MHPTLSRYISRLSGHSSAKTPKGILAFVQKHGLPPREPRKYSLRPKWVETPTACNELAILAENRARACNRRKRNFQSAVPSMSDSPWTLHTFRYKGKFSGYSGSDIVPQYQSYFRIARNSGGCCTLIQEGKKPVTRFAPKGFRYRVDGLGAFLEDSLGRSYHFGASEFRSPGFHAMVKREMISASRRNREAEKARKVEAEKARKVSELMQCPDRLGRYWVSLDDSRNAGNCALGSLQFASRIVGSDTIGGLRADVLARYSDADPRARKALEVALMRQVN